MRGATGLLATLFMAFALLVLSAAPAYADPPGLPSTSTTQDGAPLALLGLALIGAGGALLRRRDTTL